jgi:hypothetical protein
VDSDAFENPKTKNVWKMLCKTDTTYHFISKMFYHHALNEESVFASN